jgi:hypothetical protein
VEIERLFFDAREQNRFQGRLFGAARELQTRFIGWRFVATEETNNDWFAAGAGAGQHVFGHLRRRRFGDERDHFSGFVGFQHVDGVEHHQAADLFAQIAPAGADEL